MVKNHMVLLSQSTDHCAQLRATLITNTGTKRSVVSHNSNLQA